MEMIFLFLKVIFASIIGFYLVRFKGKKDFFCKGVISPFFGLFFLVSYYFGLDNVLWLFGFGIISYYILMIPSNLLADDFKPGLSPICFGFINIINYYWINPIMDKFLLNSSLVSVWFLFIFMGSVYLVDLSLSIRNHN